MRAGERAMERGMMRMQAVELAVTVVPVRASRDSMTYSDPDQLRDSHGSVLLLCACMAMFMARVHCAALGYML